MEDTINFEEKLEYNSIKKVEKSEDTLNFEDKLNFIKNNSPTHLNNDDDIKFPPIHVKRKISDHDSY